MACTLLSDRHIVPLTAVEDARSRGLTDDDDETAIDPTTVTLLLPVTALFVNTTLLLNGTSKLIDTPPPCVATCCTDVTPTHRPDLTPDEDRPCSDVSDPHFDASDPLPP